MHRNISVTTHATRFAPAVLGALCLACSSSDPAAGNGGTGGGGTGGSGGMSGNPAVSSTGGSGGSGGSGGMAGTAGPMDAAAGNLLAYKPCDPASRVGGFAVQLVAARPQENPPSPAFAQVNGAVRDRVDPRDLWRDVVAEGGCKVVDLPPLICNPNCSAAQICAGENRCVPDGVNQDVGSVTITGIPSPLVQVLKRYSGSFPSGTYPPYPAEAEVRLMASGGAHAPFALAGRGIPPLVFEGKNIKVSSGQPLALTWTPPAQTGSARIEIALDIAHHGNIGARIQCDVADSGSHTIPAAMITRLIAFGTAGFPTITLTRRTVDSTALAPGCVELVIAASVERDVEVEGVISCNDDRPCPGGRVCGPDLKCR